MDLIPALKNLNEAYTVKRTVNFDDLNMTIGLRSLTALEEVKVLESCKDFEGAQYVQMLKRNSLAYGIRSINGVDLEEDIQISENEKVSRFMFLCEQLDQWPSAIRDMLFDVFTDMNVEVEKRVNSSAKFDRFSMDTPSFEEAKPLFRRVEEPEPDNETDQLKKQVDEEISKENEKLNKAGG